MHCRKVNGTVILGDGTFSFFASLPELGIVSTFSFSLYDTCGVLSHCVSNLHSLMAIDGEHLFIYLFICFYPYYISSLVKCLW